MREATEIVTADEALEYLQSFPDGERGTVASTEIYTLDRMRRLLELLDHPDRACAIVHVVGTKGKGSTAAMIESCLRAAGYTTGLFISPHLVEFRERVQVNGALISPEELAAIVDERLRPAVEQLRAAGERTPLLFELLCGLAFEYYRRRGVEAAVVEAGLGGRLDATNAVAETALTAITRLGYDHMAILGHTLAEIAAEKAAVIRHGGLVVSAAQPPEAMGVIEAVCRDRSARLWTLGREWQISGIDEAPESTTFDMSGPGMAYRRLRVGLAGAHQAANAGVAVAALAALAGRYDRIGGETIRRGLDTVCWPGRLQVVAEGPLVLVDAAHNRESAQALAAAVSRLYGGRRLILVVGIFGDKDVAAVLGPLLPLAAAVVATAVEHPRAMPVQALAEAARSLGATTEEAETVPAALAHARLLAGADGAVLVTGSLRTVGEAMIALGLGHAGA